MGSCFARLLDVRATVARVDEPSVLAFQEYGPNSIPLKDSETETSSATYVNAKRPTREEQQKWSQEMRQGSNQVQRIVALCEEGGDKVALVYRTVEKTTKETQESKKEEEERKELEIYHLSARRELPYKDFLNTFMGFSRGLAELGLSARCNVSIYEETRWEWLASIYGIWMQDMVASTVYANLGEDALFYALRETECAAIVCNGKSVPLLLKGVEEEKYPACVIIYFDELPASGCEATHGCKVTAWEDVVQLGNSEKGKQHKAEPPTDNDALALIMYTSGTTGDPKGVMHTHGSIISGILALDDWLYSCLEQQPDDTYLSYLPLAHIMEFAVVNILLTRRMLIGFGNPRTLTDKTAKPHGDYAEFKPSLFAGVPRIFDTLKKTVEAKLPPPGSLKRSVFDRAYQSRLSALKAGKDTPYWNEKVFKVPRQALGGRVRFMLSGGGPLDEKTQEFVNVVFGLMVIGWGLTETVCVGAIQRVGDLTPKCTGQVLVSEELKLADAEEYKHTDEPQPRGEICLRGPFLFKGYYKQEEQTNEAMDEDGWYHTGDVGSIDSEGRVSIIGRIKALAKNAQGEYIALEQLESLYSNHPLIANNQMCVLVNPDKSYVAAIASTDEKKVTKYAEEHHIEGKYPDLLKNEELLKQTLKDMEESGKQAKRQKFEFIQRLCLVDDEWSPEHGQLTAAMKLKRGAIESQYEKEIEELFTE